MPGDAITVAVRMRPFNPREIELGTEKIVDMNGQSTIIVDPATNKKKVFNFDYSYDSFDSSSSNYCDQARIFSELGSDLIDHIWTGYNCSIFAYGQTGSGKSYSMMGYGEDRGIIPLGCEELFRRIDATDDGYTYSVEVSYLEIYNEEIRDLLSPNPTAAGSKGLPIRRNPAIGVYVDGLTRILVNNFSEINEAIETGNQTRTIAKTKMNATSSRSHSVFSVFLTKAVTDGEGTTCKLDLIDLAGSERQNKTEAAGKRLKEACAINKSLSALGNVISKLADRAKGKKVPHIPYRDSVLTSLLQESLGGNSKTIMVAAVSPAADNFDESLSTLRYADRAKKIVNKAKKNVGKDEAVEALKAEIEALRAQLEDARANGGGQSADDEFNRREMEELKATMEANEKLIAEMNMTLAEKEARSQQFHAAREAAMRDMGLSLNELNTMLGVDRDLPNLVNLNADPLMNENLVFFLRPGLTRVGKASASEPQDIVLGGFTIADEHCLFKVDDVEGEVTLVPLGGGKTFVNGVQILQPTPLETGNRIILGNRHIFRYTNPVEAASKKAAAIEAGEDPDAPLLDDNGEYVADWEYAMRELARARGGAVDLDPNSQAALILRLVESTDEANDLCEAMGKKLIFSVELHNKPHGDGREVAIRCTNLLTDSTKVWSVELFEQRYESLLAMLADVDDVSKFTIENEEDDPFFDPPSDQLIGAATVPLKDLVASGQVTGWWPVISRSASSSLGAYVVGEVFVSLKMVVGARSADVVITLSVQAARNLVTHFSKGVFAKFAFPDASSEYTTERDHGQLADMADLSYREEFEMTLTPELVTQFKTAKVAFELYGYEDVDARDPDVLSRKLQKAYEQLGIDEISISSFSGDGRKEVDLVKMGAVPLAEFEEDAESLRIASLRSKRPEKKKLSAIELRKSKKRKGKKRRRRGSRSSTSSSSLDGRGGRRDRYLLLDDSYDSDSELSSSNSEDGGFPGIHEEDELSENSSGRMRAEGLVGDGDDVRVRPNGLPPLPNSHTPTPLSMQVLGGRDGSNPHGYYEFEVMRGGRTRTTVTHAHSFKVVAGTGQATIAARKSVGGKGRWYYEVLIKHTGGKLRVGWVDEGYSNNLAGNGLGEDTLSWGIDLERHAKYHRKGFKYATVIKEWQDGDVVGCMYDGHSKKLSYTLNGREIGVAFTGVVGNIRPAVSVGILHHVELLVYKQNQKSSPPDKFKAIGGKMPQTGEESGQESDPEYRDVFDVGSESADDDGASSMTSTPVAVAKSGGGVAYVIRNRKGAKKKNKKKRPEKNVATLHAVKSIRRTAMCCDDDEDCFDTWWCMTFLGLILACLGPVIGPVGFVIGIFAGPCCFALVYKQTPEYYRDTKMYALYFVGFICSPQPGLAVMNVALAVEFGTDKASSATEVYGPLICYILETLAGLIVIAMMNMYFKEQRVRLRNQQLLKKKEEDAAKQKDSGSQSGDGDAPEDESLSDDKAKDKSPDTNGVFSTATAEEQLLDDQLVTLIVKKINQEADMTVTVVSDRDDVVEPNYKMLGAMVALAVTIGITQMLIAPLFRVFEGRGRTFRNGSHWTTQVTFAVSMYSNFVFGFGFAGVFIYVLVKYMSTVKAFRIFASMTEDKPERCKLVDDTDTPCQLRFRHNREIAIWDRVRRQLSKNIEKDTTKALANAVVIVGGVAVLGLSGLMAFRLFVTKAPVDELLVFAFVDTIILTAFLTQLIMAGVSISEHPKSAIIMVQKQMNDLYNKRKDKSLNAKERENTVRALELLLAGLQSTEPPKIARISLTTTLKNKLVGLAATGLTTGLLRMIGLS